MVIWPSDEAGEAVVGGEPEFCGGLCVSIGSTELVRVVGESPKALDEGIGTSGLEETPPAVLVLLGSTTLEELTSPDVG